MGPRRGIALLCLLALAGSACGGDDEGSASEPTPTTAGSATTTDAPATTAPPATTTVATTAATEPGDLIEVEPIDAGGLDAVAYRVLYRSETIGGDPIEVSGMVIAPDDAATVDDRPVLAVAHGTVGMGDSCAPSARGVDETAAAFLAPYLEAGYVVTATDYEGLGTDGLHPYIVGGSQARGVIDSVRAARNIDGLGASEQVVVWGHSQGGHAAVHTAQLWGDLASELELLGVAAGAPPSQFALLADFLKGSDFQGYLVMVAAGLAAAYEDLDLESILTPTGIEGLSTLEEGCTAEIFGYYNPLTYEEIVAVPDIFADPAWAAALLENDSNQRPVGAPLLILHGGEDEQIPVASSEVLLAQLCGLGDAPIERRVYPGMGHAEAVQAYAAELRTWVADRVAGAPAVDQCPAG
jgi:pimeloyl-ACP methyl ester carboxylesterase